MSRPCVTVDPGCLPRLADQAMARGLPFSGTLELTHRCTHQCRHCYCNRPAADDAARARELPAERWLALLEEIAGAGGLWLLFTGGECLLHPGFPEIWAGARRLGFLPTLFTNGEPVTEEVADFLGQWPPVAVEITIYGGTETTARRVTGRPASLAAALTAARRLLDREIPVKLKTMVLAENIGELDLMRELAGSLGVEFRFDAQPHARPGDPGRVEGSRLSPSVVAALDRLDPDRWRAWREFAATALAAPGNGDGSDPGLFPCSAGLSSYHIDPYGRLTMCGMVSWYGWDLTCEDFTAAWQAMGRVRAGLEHTDRPVCRACGLYDLCNLCPGWSMVEAGSLSAPVDFLCRVTHQRAALLLAGGEPYHELRGNHG